ncbi:hypothetical protein K4K54_007714 [Colletotrichum sp. SAR 10_86]|nr:hypothetical protein K4K54_007714 [Colletotrichum sp. SAR 10_86]KAJ5004537.1 hypothetical protein K4K48_009529 [Colletotrichum sp. SAR 10_66]
MKFSLQNIVMAFAAAHSVAAAAVEDPAMAAVRRDTLLMERQGANDNRPVPNGACCVANTSLKQDVCNVNGQTGRCVPDSINNCGAQLTCIEDSRLTCDPNTLERGRPLCRRTPGA